MLTPGHEEPFEVGNLEAIYFLPVVACQDNLGQKSNVLQGCRGKIKIPAKSWKTYIIVLIFQEFDSLHSFHKYP